jgi:hypothetical protein
LILLLPYGLAAIIVAGNAQPLMVSIYGRIVIWPALTEQSAGTLSFQETSPHFSLPPERTKKGGLTGRPLEIS